jgi:uncharacterized protein YukE
MRYARGSIVISPAGDIPLLREVRNARFVSRRQLFTLLDGAVPLSRSTYTSRLGRLLDRDYVRAMPGIFWHGTAVYSIAPKGLMELESQGEFAIALHSGTRHMPHPLHVYHALELNEIRLALVRSALLAAWESEIEIASSNLVRARFQKDYDALVRIWAGGQVREFALEYERSLKAARRYVHIREALEREVGVGAILYLTASPDLMFALLYHLTPTSKPLAFACTRQFHRHLMATPVFTDARQPPVTLDHFLAAAAVQTAVSAQLR